MLAKAEACRELAVSLSTLDRRIASGEIETRREPRGRRHRVYVMLDDDPPSTAENQPSTQALARDGFTAWRDSYTRSGNAMTGCWKT